MSLPVVSIIVPIYNVEQYLEECLNSLVNQTLKDIEIICVNDGSPDYSADIVRRYMHLDARITLIEQENRGLSGARNTGLRVAKGEYVYFMDSDDWLEADAIEICYNAAKKDNIDVVLFDALAFNDDDDLSGDVFNNYDRRSLLNSYAYTVVSAENLFAKMLSAGAMRASACLNFIKRSILVKNQLTFEEGLIHEDELFTPQLYALANTMMYIPRMFFHRRVRSGSIMTSVKKEKTLLTLSHIIAELCAFAKNHNQSRSLIYLRCYELMVHADNLMSGYIQQHIPQCCKIVNRQHKWSEFCRKVKKHLL